jgi:hypothetical protein
LHRFPQTDAFPLVARGAAHNAPYNKPSRCCAKGYHSRLTAIDRFGRFR